jgi:hypothetical protein|nr:MAG TPA: hypothetical protein [Caudoviricetes sp.]
MKRTLRRTLYNCPLIRKMVAKGEGEPKHQDMTCIGYQKSENDNEPCETCKNCKLNYMYGENDYN